VGDPGRLPRTGKEAVVTSPRSGFVAGVDARGLGDLLVEMGGGRARKEDAIDPAVGIRLLAKTGQPVREGEPVAILDVREGAGSWPERARAAFTIGDVPVPVGPLVLEEIP
jgi:thymidine phosphorylase